VRSTLINVATFLGTLLLFASGLAVAQSAAPTVPPSAVGASAEKLTPPPMCDRPFPYSAQEFMHKLVRVADETDPNLNSVQKRVAEVFQVRTLQKLWSADGQRFAYGPKESCDWYVHLAVWEVHALNSKTVASIEVDIGERSTILEFKETRKSICLTLPIADRVLKADGWTGGVPFVQGWSQYQHGSTNLILAWILLGSFPDRQSCVDQVGLSFTVPHKEL